MRRCSGCAGLWLDPAPLGQDLGLAYQSYPTHTPAKKGWRAQWRSAYARLLEARLRSLAAYREMMAHHRQRRLMHLGDLPAGLLLDVGCGSGKFLHRMRKRGWRVVGIDFDPQAIRQAREKYGITAYTGDLREIDLRERDFDAIVMNHAIEHVERPVELLRACRTLLRPGGRLVLITPNATSTAQRRYGPYWRGLEVPRHLQVFSRDGLAECVRAAGLVLQRAESFSCDAEVVHRASVAMARQQQGRDCDPLLATRHAWRMALAEQKALRRTPDCGEDLLLIATRPD